MGDERYVDEELSKAREALDDADRLASSGGTAAGTVNRLYFAAFHAAQATLYDRGVEPSTTQVSGIGSARSSFSTAPPAGNTVASSPR